jgi:hypothetical protein
MIVFVAWIWITSKRFPTAECCAAGEDFAAFSFLLLMNDGPTTIQAQNLLLNRASR